jgi:light-regulated signal transduction histidine kinase (bacteriophytochrome)
LNSLEANLQKSQVMLKAHIVQVEKKLLEQINSIANTWEQRSKYYSLKTQAEEQKLQQELDILSQYSHENLDFIHKSLNTKTNNLKIEIAQSKSDLDRDLTSFKQQLLTKLEANLAELTINKISHADLAEVLFELSLKLKGTDVDSNPPNSEDLEKFREYSSDSSQKMILPETE